MAHQSHNLPWNLLAGLLVRKAVDNGGSLDELMQTRMDLLPASDDKDDVEAEKKVRHFALVLDKELRDFAQTEKKKVSNEETCSSSKPKWSSSSSRRNASASDEKLISDRLIAHVQMLAEDISPTLQYAQTWKDNLGDGHWIEAGEMIKMLILVASTAFPSTTLPATTDHDSADDADLAREALQTLLTMAHDPRVKLGRLQNMSWGHHFGVSRVAEEALKGYIYFNILYVKTSEDGRVGREYRGYPSYDRLLDSITGSYDGDAQNRAHRAFLLSSAPSSAPLADQGAHERIRVDLLSDLTTMKEYLKALWRMLVIYQLVFEKVGNEIHWPEMVSLLLAQIYRLYLPNL